ncbi:MAG: hypothetical protein ABI718_14260 [Acidobacteriota bacterium]
MSIVTAPNESARQGKRRIFILALLILPLAFLHLSYRTGNGPFEVDSSFYMQVARFVADGDGLSTRVSLYFNGLNPLPQAYDLYPLWPLLLGYTARLTGLYFAANYLPQLFYILNLILFYVITTRLSVRMSGNPVPVFRYGEDVFDAGHLVVLLFGLNFIFFECTVYPYTEGLAFFTGLAAVLALDLNDRLPVAVWSVGSGFLAGLSFLARFQMVVVLLASVLVLFLAACFHRRFRVGFVLYVSTACLVTLPWMFHISRVRLQRVKLPEFAQWVQSDSTSARMFHVIGGLLHAFDPAASDSYFGSFGAVVFVLPLALIIGVLYQGKARRDATVLNRSRDPGVWLMASTLVMAGIASTGALALYKSAPESRWLYGERHSLPFLFVLCPALVWTLARGGRWFRLIAITFAVLSILTGARLIASWPVPAGEGLAPAEREAMNWLDRHVPSPVVMTTKAQILSVYSKANFHWTSCRTDPAQTRLMLRALPIEYVLVSGSERDCPFLRDMGDVLSPETVFENGGVPLFVLRVRPEAKSPSPHPLPIVFPRSDRFRTF